MARLKDYLSLVKFSHTIFAMPFALLGFVLGLTQNKISFEWTVLLYIILCMVFARNAAMGFNRYIDRKIDALNVRTANREIPAGKISPTTSLIFVILNSVLFIVCSFFINKLCFYLSPLTIVLLLSYSYTKRFTSFCHVILGVCLAIAPAGAYIAVTGTITLPIVLLSLTVLTWSAGFDVIYSLQDIDFDKENNLFSIPVKFGLKNALLISAVLHLFSFSLVIFIGFLIPFQILGWIGSGLFLILLVYQHVIVKPNDLTKVNAAFFTVNGLASVLYAIFGIFDLWSS